MCPAIPAVKCQCQEKPGQMWTPLWWSCGVGWREAWHGAQRVSHGPSSLSPLPLRMTMAISPVNFIAGTACLLTWTRLPSPAPCPTMACWRSRAPKSPPTWTPATARDPSPCPGRRSPPLRLPPKPACCCGMQATTVCRSHSQSHCIDISEYLEGFILLVPPSPFVSSFFFPFPLDGTRGWVSGWWTLKLKPVSCAVGMAWMARAAVLLYLLKGSSSSAVVHNHHQVGGKTHT